MKRRKILYLFPLAALVLSGCSFQEAVASLKSFLSNSVYHPAKDFIDGLSGKTSEEEQKDQPSGEGDKPSGEGEGGEGGGESQTTVHAGTLEDPFDAKDAKAKGKDLDDDAYTDEAYYVKGVVQSIDEEFNISYGNYTFSIEEGFKGYRLKKGESFEKFAANDIEEGDTVLMYGKIKVHKETFELDGTASGGAYVVSVTKPAPEGVELVSISIEGTAKSEYVSGDKYGHEGLSVTAHYDDESTQDVTNSVLWSYSKETAELGDSQVTITATFNGKSASKEVAVTVVDGSTTQHAGTESDPYTGLDAYIVGGKLASGEVTSEFFYIEGEVVSFEENFNAEYGNYSFKMEGGFIGWRMLAGAKLEKFAEGDLKVGDVVTLYTKIQNYQGKPESKEGYIKKINGVEQGTPDTPIDPSTLTEKVVFELGENGEATHSDGSAATTYTETISGVTLSITDGEKMYTGARDAAGNSCIKFATGSAAASFKIDISSVSGLKKVVFNIANYKANSGATIAINGNDPIEITGTSNASEYDAVAFDITDEELLTIELPKRAMLNSIEFCPAEAPTVPVESVSIEEDSLTLHIGGQNEKLSETLHATVLPEEATNKTVAWSIDGECATIDAESGLVTAVKSGSATVTAVAGGQSDTCEVTVIKHVSGVEINESISVVAGEDSADPLQVTISPEGVTNDHFSLESSDESVATVNAQGYVHGVSAGTATITVTTEDGGFTDTCTVTVEAKVIAVESVARISEESQNLLIGEQVTLEAKVMPEDTTQSKALSWSLQSGDAVTVNAESGLVEAVKEGVSVVRATSVANSSAYADFTINVSKVAVSSVSLDQQSLELAPGGTADLVATVSPQNATNKDVTWASDNVSAATVDQNGHVIAVADGTAHITVTSDDDNTKFASCTVTVETPAPEKGTLENPYTVSEAKAVFDELDDKAVTGEVYVKGYINGAIKPELNSGRGKFYITDGVCPVDLYVLNINNIGGSNNLTLDDIPVGSEIVGKGVIKKYVDGDNRIFEMCWVNGSVDCNLISVVKHDALSVSIGGVASQSEYVESESYNHNGLTASAVYDLGNEQTITLDVTDSATWTCDPATATKGDTSFNVTASVGAVSSAAKNVGVTVSSASAEETEKTYVFGDHSDFSSWSSSYTSHTLDYTECSVVFASANKNTTTITDKPVTKGGAVELKAKSGKKIKSVTFVCAQWGSKTQTITLHYSTDGGSSYTSTGVTSTNFTISSASLNSLTNAVKITFSSSSNQVGIASATVTFVG